uniref:Uncharacterized protein n=1 Tax=Anopheles minimus TaxID=112268 RepID=A0A182WQ43_9DIPT
VNREGCVFRAIVVICASLEIKNKGTERREALEVGSILTSRSPTHTTKKKCARVNRIDRKTRTTIGIA